jgi:hypothetical protein
LTNSKLRLKLLDLESPIYRAQKSSKASNKAQYEIERRDRWIGGWIRKLPKL